jgi:phosphoribosylformylglycinamidine synthase PurS subunit
VYKAIINVMLKDQILDPQGVAVQASLHYLGYTEVKEVRIHKRIEVVLDCNNKEDVEEKVKSICQKVLSNPVMEHYTYELGEMKECVLPS